MEAEQGEVEIWVVVHVADDDLLAPHIDGDGATACDEDLDAVGEGDVLVVDAVLVDECLLEGTAVVDGTTVNDGHLAGG